MTAETSSVANIGRSERFTELDAMRGLAAILVVGHHVAQIYGLKGIFDRGYLAVDFFFMLSGFVMARTYEDRLKSGRLSAFSFMVARYRRLWAPIAVGSAIGLIFFLVSDDLPGGAAIVAGFAMIPALWLEKPYPLNRPAWSIFFEIAANALHGLVFARVSAKVVIAIAGCSAIVLAYYGHRQNSIGIGFMSADYVAGLARVLTAYCIGIVLWRLRRPPFLPAGTATALLVAGLLLLPHGLFWELGFVLILCPILVICGARPFGGWPSDVLGALSFPLYAVHFPVLQLSAHLGFSPIIGGLGALAVAVVVGVFVDKRLGSMVRSFWRFRPAGRGMPQ